MIDISVIIPMYNAEKHIRKCLDSLLIQQGAQFEFIIVDDGSTDNSFSICKEYSLKDERIRLIHKENGGSVSARNTGIEIAEGRFIAFADSDDYVDDNYLNDFINLANSMDADIVVKPYVIETNGSAVQKQLNFEAGLYQGDKKRAINRGILATDIRGEKSIYSSLWGKLFKSSLVKQYYRMVSNRIREGEDLILVAACCTRANTIFLDSDSTTYYHYVQNDGQVTRNYDPHYEERLPHLYDCIIRLNEMVRIEEFNCQFEKLVMFYTCKGFDNMFYRNSSLTYKEKLQKIKRLCEMARSNVAINNEPNESFNFRIKRFLVKHSCNYLIFLMYSAKAIKR